MTIKEFYEWACAHECENYQFGMNIDIGFVEDSADGYDTGDCWYCAEVASEDELRIGELWGDTEHGFDRVANCVWIEGREDWR